MRTAVTCLSTTGRTSSSPDRFAGRLLSSPVEYTASEPKYGHPPVIRANELGTPVTVLKTWQSLYERQAV